MGWPRGGWQRAGVSPQNAGEYTEDWTRGGLQKHSEAHTKETKKQEESLSMWSKN